MGISIDLVEARRVIAEAVDIARSDERVPDEWYLFARDTFGLTAKTYTPALGTALLARAVDDRIDPLALKIGHSERAYNFRTLGHEVLVPAAQRFGFSIRNTGGEPLNNQPFFRFDHLTLAAKVRDPEALAWFIQRLRRLDALSAEQALFALAAFIRVGFEVTASRQSFGMEPNASIRPNEAALVADTFLEDDNELPRRAQALAAAILDVGFLDVRSRKLNDPSRDVPGDVQAFAKGAVLLSAEVRTKLVDEDDALRFFSRCYEAGVERAYMLAFAPRQARAVPYAKWDRREHRIFARTYYRPSNLLRDILVFVDQPLTDAVDALAVSCLRRLDEIEASEDSMRRWVELIENPPVTRFTRF